MKSQTFSQNHNDSYPFASYYYFPTWKNQNFTHKVI